MRAMSYLCGSVPTACGGARPSIGVDVREHGSRNAGATNTFRVLGPRAGVPVLLIDMLKGFLPVRVLAWWSGLEDTSADYAWLRGGHVPRGGGGAPVSGVRGLPRWQGGGHFHEDSSVKIGFSVLLSLLVIYTHRENIGRLLKGEENRTSFAGRADTR
jgi:glycerol-3-phosphate acyltransferase PlsY